jgi:uncharacterized protein (TIGR02117 family)
MGHVFTSLPMRRILTACLAAGVLQMLVGCQKASLPARPMLPRGDVTAYVIAAGWHTEIALPVSAITGPLQALTRDFPTAQYLRFGWGEREYYMARQPTAGDAFRALFPAPAVLLVTPLDRAPSSTPVGSRTFAVGLTTAEAGRLADYIWAAFGQPIDGTPGRLGFGPYSGSAFYAASGTYSATYTCNTWTADALRAGGIPVDTVGVVIASQLTNQLEVLFDAVH